MIALIWNVEPRPLTLPSVALGRRRTAGRPANAMSGCTGLSTLNAQNGTASVIWTTQGLAGAIGYGDLSAWGPNTGTSAVILAGVRNATNTAYITPGTFTGGSNCNIGVKGLPGSTTDDAVGLNGAPTPTTSSLTWAWTPRPPRTTSRRRVPTTRSAPSPGTCCIRTRARPSTPTVARRSPASPPTTWLDTLRQGFQADF
jgi:hypothetical protein